MDDVEDLIVDLRNVEERLRDLAYERLRAAVEDDDAERRPTRRSCSRPAAPSNGRRRARRRPDVD